MGLNINTLFTPVPEFLLGVVDEKQLPISGFPEIAFAGRSNVGKSSLINAVTGVKGLARVSSTPGRTQQLNFFGVGDKFNLVDLPGYGYAKAPKAMVDNWTDLILRYLKGRAQLKRVFLLIDSRHGIKPVDENVMQVLDTAAVLYQLVLTKTDKISGAELEKILADTRQKSTQHTACFPEILATSSEKKQGLDTLKKAIIQTLEVF